MQQTQTDLDNIGEFYRRYYEDAIGQLGQRYPSEQKSLEVDFQDIFTFDPDLADDLRERPGDVLEWFEEALSQYEVPANVELDDASVIVGNLPDSATLDVGEYRSSDIGNYVTVSGQIAKKTEVRPRPLESAFECQRCGTITRISQVKGDLQTPHECQGCERQGPFRTNQPQSKYTDHQLLRLKQPPEEAKGGDGASIDVHVEGDLVGQVEAGDRVNISGIVYLDDDDPEDQTAFDPYLDGHHVDVEETDYEDIDVEEYEDEIKKIAAGEYGDPYELLVDSIAQKIEGMEEIKEAVALQLFSGVRKEYPDGTSDRGTSHILLLGDPGTAKSKVLKAVESIAPRGVFASGKGASAAGMTAAAVNDDFGDNSWTLEAGALVLANNGIACVDEIDKVDETAVNSMHTALEQQVIHVNKAGIDADLPAKTSLLAAGNPKRGRFDPNMTYAEQIDLDPAMISRFDLMFMVDDQPDEERDSEIIRAIGESHKLGARYTADPDSLSDEELDEISPAIDEDTLRAYIAYARREVTPELTDEFLEALDEWYVDLRMANGSGEDVPIPVTARNGEGVIRLAEASARVRLSETVEIQDLERAQRLVKRSMRDVGMDPDTGQFDADIVETGTSKNQRGRIDDILAYIADQERETGDAVPMEDILDFARETQGMGVNQTRHDVKKLKQKGEIYEPEYDNSFRSAN